MSIRFSRNSSKALSSWSFEVFTSSHGSLHRKSLSRGSVTVAVRPVVYWGESDWIDEVVSRRSPV